MRKFFREMETKTIAMQRIEGVETIRKEGLENWALKGYMQGKSDR